MSNLGTFNSSKNTPWMRPVANNTNNIVNQQQQNNTTLQQQILNQGGLANMGTSNMVQFQPPHQQVFQNAMGIQQQNLGLGLQQMSNPSVLGSNQLFQQVGAVSYPNPRALNPTAFQTQSLSAVPVQNSNNTTSMKQRVFTGIVTKVHDNFGFVDEDVFFQTSACVKGINPMVGDRVLVEASYNPNMPFKWNATRIQVLPTSGHSSSSRNSSQKNVYGLGVQSDSGSGFSKSSRSKASMSGRGRERSRERDDDEIDRKRRREERMREREKDEKKSPLRRRSRTPKSRRRSRIVPRYMVQIPKINLELRTADVLEIRRRYNNLYVPSDFFCSYFRWVEAFPPDKPFVLSKPSLFHIMHKDVDPVVENDVGGVEPLDADYLFSVKVMLMSVPGMEDIFHKCCAMAEDKDKRDRDSEERDYVHPTRLIQFLVGLRGKNETMAIGGPWSPSLDGDSPATDSSVLIRTAIRTCKSLTGIDLSPCTQWYRFLELYYHRNESTHKGKVIPSRVETVVLFLPDVWSCLPTRLEWDGLHLSYRKQLEDKLKADQECDEHPTADEKDEEPSAESKIEPTDYTQLDPKNLSVSQLRTELKARNIHCKGLKSQLVARLTKALKSEAEKAEDSSKECHTEPESETGEDKKMEIEEKKLDEKEKAQLEKRYTLPEQPHIIVHPSRTAKSGKFDCTNMSLSVLLDYCTEDTKEHSFEVSLFAELFNEMLMRDFGFNVYKALYELPEKVKEKDEKKYRDEDEKQHKRDDQKSDDKRKDDKRDSKKKEDVNSDDDEDDFDEDENSKDKKRSDKDKKKKERPRMFTKDRTLLLSFVYFDQTHCGYIFEKDMEDLLFTLGLNLSRAQVRKLVGKVITRDSLHYRKLTDKPKEDDFIVIDDSEKDINLQDLAAGNKKLLPIFNNETIPSIPSTESNKEGLLMFRGGLVDVAKLMAQLERSDRARIDTEARMVDLKTENTRVTEKYTKSSSNIKFLNSEVKDLKEKLRSSDESLIRMTACSKLFQTTLSDIRDKIDPVLKSTLYDKEDRKERDDRRDREERKHEEGRTRWEKNLKEVVTKAESPDLKILDSTNDVIVEVKDDVSS